MLNTTNFGGNQSQIMLVNHDKEKRALNTIPETWIMYVLMKA